MIDKHSQSVSHSSPTSQSLPTDRMVLLVPQGSMGDSDVNLVELWSILWRGRWLIVIVTLTFAAVSILYVLTATRWYRSSVLLTPAETQTADVFSRSLGGLGGLASLAGINVEPDGSTEAIAVLKSRDFTRAFIEDKGLLTVLFADEWDSAAGSWKAKDSSDQPDIRDAIKYFHENVMRVSTESDTGLVTLSIDWTEPEVAAEWASDLVARLNDFMRHRALEEAQYNVSYLEKELADTDVASLRQSISNILEAELQKLMLAKGNEEFAFHVVDSAQVPKDAEKPKRLLIVLVVSVLGGVLGVFLVFFRHALKDSGALTTAGSRESGESLHK